MSYTDKQTVQNVITNKDVNQQTVQNVQVPKNAPTIANNAKITVVNENDIVLGEGRIVINTSKINQLTVGSNTGNASPGSVITPA
jgi:archaeosine-15-forming tRNA-guanine transglycosylase